MASLLTRIAATIPLDIVVAGVLEMTCTGENAQTVNIRRQPGTVYRTRFSKAS
jgi:hypothetical protein